MEFVLIWLIVQLLNLALWLCFARLPVLRLLLDRTIQVRLKRRSPRNGKTALSHIHDKCTLLLENMHTLDKADISGFAPPRVLRALVGSILVAQNVLALSILSDTHALLRRSGQLACINLICLVLVACPDVMEIIARQTTPQTTWAHHLYGWIVWYEVLIHVLAYAMLSVNISKLQ
ncbi:hypothetical protein ISF_10013 [Cordyceps fumosorosea ARSEF 2679]|uniref:Uncharacterized protein n=1 Tax=Cordyceps fumosorosea (strain ARSEF 2679) TaxID=1081104 RepID=A0A166W6S5_CORFA|nr:hypothetical protein ISF_10013 [Cordyceps fumosorosea ARSEF 2679]OAA34399.1 hypothetical protein ISF_10013 [Cordyceps fumosorosea ARSEF 2679]